MKFNEILQPAFFVRRYKRFLVDLLLPNSETLTVYCPNTGRMTSCLSPHCKVLISKSTNPNRKYPHTLEMTFVSGTWIGVNTARTNSLVREAIENNIVREIGSFDYIRPEIKTSKGSRLDFLLQKGTKKTYLEVKNCTLAEDGIAMFPDAVTARGTKHINELIRLHENGHGAILFFCIQRMDTNEFAPARHVDPAYADKLQEAADKGVQIIAYQAKVTPTEITITHSMAIANYLKVPSTKSAINMNRQGAGRQQFKLS